MYAAKLVTTISISDLILLGSLLVTLVVAIGTLALALNSRNTLREMISARDADTAPFVVVYFDVPHGEEWADLVVKNIGNGVARNVRVKLTPDLANTLKDNLMELSMIRDGIAMMPPGYEIRTTLDFLHKYLEAGLPMRYDAHITYSGGINNAKRSTDCVADLAPFKFLSSIERHGIHDLVNSVKSLASAVAKLHP